MNELLTAAQMKAIEAAAIASGEVTGLELMERAGRGVVKAIFQEWPDLAATSHRAVVLCGPGGNGGDGFVVARLLKEWGWEVEVFLYGTPEQMPPDARVNYERWAGMGEVARLDSAAPAESHGNDIVIDALFGIGLARKLEGAALTQADHCMHYYGFFQRARAVSIDVPSGLCADSGRRLDPEGYGFRADLTVTFHRRKIGHLVHFADVCGRTRVVDLEIVEMESAFDDESFGGGITFENLPCASLAFDLSKETHSHKYAHGHALILSGPSGHGGAARLAARGALRIGAGVVTVACSPDTLAENAARLDAVMLRVVADGAALAAMLEVRRINALCLGPGMGLDAGAVGLVAVALGCIKSGPPPPSPPHRGEGGEQATSAVVVGEAPSLPPVGRGQGWGATSVVLDADALTILSRHPDLFAALHPNCILTPHAGEFARLFPDIAAKLSAPATKGPAYSKVDATREAAKRAGCVVLYKGPDTVIAAPDGRCSINSAHYDRAAPWLATAGSGDVLAGFITGLLARGFAPMQAAETAAWLHVECARSFGPGLIAEDLAEELPKVFRLLGL